MCAAAQPASVGGSQHLTDEALRQKLRQYSQFFDRLVELVPAKYYVDANDRDEPANTRYMKKSAKAEAKKAAKEAAKKRKREKLDPDSAQTTLDVQREQARKKQKPLATAAEPTEASGRDDGKPSTSSLRFGMPTGEEPSAGQLRDRLHSRIEELRRERKAAEEKKQRSKAAKEWRRQASGRPPPAAKDGAAAAAAAKKQEKPQAAAEPPAQLSFGRLEVGPPGGGKQQKKGKGGGKAASKAELLEAARAKAEQRAALEGTREGRVAYEQDAWKAAMARARGERVLDDPKLLSRSLRKEEKLRQKKAQAWKERQGLHRKEQAAKQKKRTDNLKARTDTKLKNRKDKREKKLLRAGFEGRRDSFIGSDK